MDISYHADAQSLSQFHIALATHSSWLRLSKDYFRDGRALQYGSKRFEGIEEYTHTHVEP